MKNNNYILMLVLYLSISTNAISQEKDVELTFDDIQEIQLIVNEEDYIDIIRSSLFDQPEFKYATSLSTEQEFNLKYARRGRFGTITSNVINDESIDRNITDDQSVRKRRDDSFDATVEFRQPIYTGGQINAAIQAARSKAFNLSKEKQNTISKLILDANRKYLDAVSNSFLYSYSQSLLDKLKPFKERVGDRISSGIMDPIDAALFNVRFNRIETLVYQLKSLAEKSNNSFYFFFKLDYETLGFPRIFINESSINKNRNSYEVDTAKYTYEEKKAGIKTARSDYLPKFGVSTRYTKYDIDDDSNEDDVRGGLYFSMPIFSFGRGIAKINSAKAAAEASRNAINVSEKDDNVSESSLQSEFENAINNRPIFLQSFNETVNQRSTIEDRLELSGFAANAFAEVVLNEITQLKTLLDNETQILDGYFALLHQNQQLNNKFRIDLN